jgi:hypothetical protein
MNYTILNDNVIEMALKEHPFSYVLFMDPTDDSRRFKNLFDKMSMDIMDEAEEVKFYIINVHAHPKSLDLLNIQKSDIPTFRFYSYMNEIPYTEHFWNRFRMADYVRQRILNKVVYLNSKEEVGRILHYNNAFMYFHDNSIHDSENEVLRSLESMACLYHELKVFMIRDEALFEYVKTLAPLDRMPNLKNKKHILVYHSEHTGINVLGFNEDILPFEDMRQFYRTHRFGLILDYNRDVHDFLFIENMTAVFLFVKEVHYRDRKKKMDWGKYKSN